METKVIIPAGAPQQSGRLVDNNLLDRIASDLYELTRLLVERYPDKRVGGFLGGEFGYGVDFKNDVFMMHPYCWCEKDDCPWCAGCSCEHKYFYGNTEVDCETFFAEDFSERETKFGARRTELAVECDVCKKGGSAANFESKTPDGTSVTVHWYKYIGRGMEISENLTYKIWNDVYNKAVDSLK